MKRSNVGDMSAAILHRARNVPRPLTRTLCRTTARGPLGSSSKANSKFMIQGNPVTQTRSCPGRWCSCGAVAKPLATRPRWRRCAGELTTVWVPDASHEAVRDLVRAREAAMYWRNRARQALSSFLLRHGYHYGGRSAWTASYWRWLATLKLEHPAQ